ncbi:MAG: DUF1028 domain-containing protein [Albidovulum sp.]|nr:DUF1028 domain-containing protein [Albidovulum sp.]MDE0533820.1 DUF1028 domain-containing protein [Albidovulum sp.]
MTFSIVARCRESGMFGTAVSSSSPAVAARCAGARAGVGAVSSQNVTDPTLRGKCLELMEQGATSTEAVAILSRTAMHMPHRQLLAIDKHGNTAVHSGEKTLGTWSSAQGVDAACAGNLLAREAVPDAMLEAFEGSRGHLGDRLLRAMRAALDAGGEAGPVHSAGMYLVREVAWPVADVRVDWSDSDPIAELDRVWSLYKPQLEDYVSRALNPESAPSYGVPGDE